MAAAAQDYPGFYTQEIAFRRAMHYPPFGSLGLILLSGQQDKTVRDKLLQVHALLTARLAELAREQPDHLIELLEPARAPLYMLRGRYRYRLILKGQDNASLMSFLNSALARMDFGQVSVTIDVDPYSLL